jgi:membrane dipeptidase
MIMVTINRLLIANVLTVVCSVISMVGTAQSGAGKYTVSEMKAKELVAQVQKSSPVIDGHNDLFVRYFDCKTCPLDLKDYRIDTLNKGQTDIPRWRKGGLGGQLINIFGREKTLESILDAYDLLYRMQDNYPADIRIVGTAKEMRNAMSEGRIALLPSLEGATRLNNDMTLLRSFYKLGLRSVTFAYKTNDLADGSDDYERHKGISSFGEEIVKEMNRLGVLIDMSHISAAAMNDILNITKAPVIFSHSNARALCNVNRNVPDAVLKRLKENDGIIMLTFVPYFTREPFNDWMTRGDTLYYRTLRNFPGNKDTLNAIMEKWEREDIAPVVTVADIADHFDYVRKLIGVDHIGMAGDYDGIQFTIKGLEDAGCYPKLLIELARRGWTEDELRKISGENFLRVFEKVESVAGRLQMETLPSIIKYGKTAKVAGPRDAARKTERR